MSVFTPLLNHPGKTFDARPEINGGIVSLTRKTEKILAGEDIDIQAECKQVKAHKLDSKEIVRHFDHILFA